MRKIHLLLILAVSLFLSCKKEKEDDAYHISCKIDGVEKTFNAVIVAGAVVNEGVAGLVITGASTASEKSDGMAFVLTRSGGSDAIAAGTYADAGTDFQLLASHYVLAADIDYDAGTEMYKEAVHYDKTIANHFSLVLSSIDNNTARGTFSGDFFPDADINGVKKTITEGSFYVKLVSNY